LVAGELIPQLYRTSARTATPFKLTVPVINALAAGGPEHIHLPVEYLARFGVDTRA
jgi:hypothetical protein